jgi:hypothetical protein
MALRPLRNLIADDVQFRCNNVAEKGSLVVYSTTAGEVELPPASTVTTASPSGRKVAGLLLEDVVSRSNPSLMGRLGDPLGITDLPRNLNKQETHVSGQVWLAKVGMFITNRWDQTDPSAGGTVYITNSGLFSAAALGTGYASVGHALTAKDTNGYVKIWVNITT